MLVATVMVRVLFCFGDQLIAGFDAQRGADGDNVAGIGGINPTISNASKQNHSYRLPC
jgi:hypothetical protein